MTEILITFLIVCLICFIVYWAATKLLPSPAKEVGQVIAIAIACIWLLTHLRELIHAFAGT